MTITTDGTPSSTFPADQFTYAGSAPTVTSISPNDGPTTGGTVVAITGTNFTGVTSVKFGSNNAVLFTVLSVTQIAVSSPAGTGTVDVTVTTADGTSATSTADHFTYTASRPSVTSISPTSGPAAGGTSVTITGTNLTEATAIKFGSTAATTFTVNSATQITATSPAGSGTVDVTVTSADGTSATSTADQFSYIGGPSTISLASSLNPSQLGQTVTFTATVTSPGGTPTGTVTFKDGGSTLVTVPLSAGLAAYATASLTVGSHSITVTYNGDSNFPASTSTALAQSVNIPADSLKLKALQNQVSPLVAQSSGAAITGAIDGAINDAFGNGGSPVTVGPNGVSFNFTAEPRSEVTRRADEAFDVLGYALGSSIVAKSPPLAPIRQRDWSLWADVRGTGWERSNPNADLKGDQINVTAGIGRKLTPDLLIGIAGGYEHFKYDSVSLTGTMKGAGGTIGGYAAWRFTPTLRWDATLAWSSISYDAIAGTASGTFTGSRWLASTGLTGRYPLAAIIFEPSAKVYALWERQGEWTDSLGTLQEARRFSVGRVATGGKVIAPWQASAGVTVAPYVGFYGDWRFSTDNAVPAGQPVVGIGNGWSGRATGGISVAEAGGGTLALGGEYGGLGANYKVWTVNGRVFWPF